MFADIAGNFAVIGTKIVFFECLGLRHGLAGCLPWQQEVWECQGCSCRAATSPAPFWERVEAQCRIHTLRVCVCTSNDVLKVEVCDPLHSVCVEQFGLHSWKLWECWPRDDLLGFPEWQEKDRKSLCPGLLLSARLCAERGWKTAVCL